MCGSVNRRPLALLTAEASSPTSEVCNETPGGKEFCTMWYPGSQVRFSAKFYFIVDNVQRRKG